MQLGPLQTFLLTRREEELTLECQMADLDEKILGAWILTGVITISAGSAILLGLANLPHNDPRGLGLIPLSFGFLLLAASWYKARLASTARFDLKQKFVTITPKWHLGRQQTYRFDEVLFLQAIKHFVKPYSFIGRLWWHDYWRLSLMLHSKKTSLLGEGYSPRGQDNMFFNRNFVPIRAPEVLAPPLPQCFVATCLESPQ